MHLLLIKNQEMKNTNPTEEAKTTDQTSKRETEEQTTREIHKEIKFFRETLLLIIRI